ncbi:MAG: septum formation protein Maf [Oscillospiraceae bacterium]|nr:septum formation protein Maf [Oscillospiraceae bacterium]
MDFVLASKSPRRKELLQFILPRFETIDAHINERDINITAPSDLCYELAKNKALAVFSSKPDSCVIGSDTMVSVDNQLLGKPKDKAEAYEMLSSLSGREHSVFTGVYIAAPDIKTGFVCETIVHFIELTNEMISEYINTDEPYDKAGGYSIQGGASIFCDWMNGDYYNVMGLPVSALYVKLRELGLI